MPISDEARERIRQGHANRDKESYRENNPRTDRLSALAQTDQESYHALLKSIAAKMLVPHSEGQKEVLLAEERFLILCAGRRWGKTKVGAAKAIRMARKGNMVWWVSPQYKNVRRAYEEILSMLHPVLLSKTPPAATALDAGRTVRVHFHGGGTIEFYSAERPDGMLGGSCDYLIMDEAATMQETVWTQYIRPTLADRQGSALFISTPRGRNWFYYLWLKGQSSNEPDYRSWHFPSRTNPTIPASEFDQMVAEMPKFEYEAEILAEFISDSSGVFRMPRDESGDLTCISPIMVPNGHVIVGLDLAKHNDYTVIIGVRAADRKPCYHDRFNQISWPIQRERIRAAIADINQTASGITILVDTGGPGDVIFDDLEELGLDVVPVNFTAWKEKAVRLLASDLEQGRALLCEEQLSEFLHYTYQVTSTGRMKYEAARGHDDEVSAMLLAHWGVVHEGPPNVQTLTVDAGGETVENYDWEDDWGYHDAALENRQDTGIPQVQMIELAPRDLLNDPSVWGH